MKSSQIQDQLIVFTRYPAPGTTKTRLALTLGHHQAAAIQQALIEHTMVQVRKFMQSHPVSVSIYFAGGSLEKLREWLGTDLIYREQTTGDLGQRMAQALAETFKNKYQRAVIIGSDCPQLKAHHLDRAFEALRQKDLVLGPATDGGYYLIGLCRLEQPLFEAISWGTKTVLAKTLSIAAEKKLAIELLEILNDVDRPEDLKHINNNSDL
jgi:uncharacterized protein